MSLLFSTCFCDTAEIVLKSNRQYQIFKQLTIIKYDKEDELPSRWSALKHGT